MVSVVTCQCGGMGPFFIPLLATVICLSGLLRVVAPHRDSGFAPEVIQALESKNVSSRSAATSKMAATFPYEGEKIYLVRDDAGVNKPASCIDWPDSPVGQQTMLCVPNLTIWENFEFQGYSFLCATSSVLQRSSGCVRNQRDQQVVEGVTRCRREQKWHKTTGRLLQEIVVLSLMTARVI